MSGHAVPVDARGVPAATLPAQLVCAPLTPPCPNIWARSCFKMGE